MAITITDPELIAKLQEAGPRVEFADGSGRVFARFVQDPTPELTARCKTQDELAAARSKGPGRTLAEILADARTRATCTG